MSPPLHMDKTTRFAIFGLLAAIIYCLLSIFVGTAVYEVKSGSATTSPATSPAAASSVAASNAATTASPAPLASSTLSSAQGGVINSTDSPNYLQSADTMSRLVVQTDNNVVGYYNGTAKWSTGTNGNGVAPTRLIMQPDGNLVLYDSTNKVLWATATSGKGTGPYTLVLQNDNAVLYPSQGGAIWCQNIGIGHC